MAEFELSQLTWETFGAAIVDVIIKSVTFVVILLIGYIVAKIVEGLVAKLLLGWKLDQKAQAYGIRRILGISPTYLVAKVFEYYVLVITLENAFYYVGILPLYQFFHQLVILIPQWAIGAIILAVGFFVAKWAQSAIREAKIAFGEFIAAMAWIIIMYVSIIFALPKFGFTEVEILQDILRIILWGISIGTAIAIGIGFGTALQPTAKKLLSKLKF